jgi:hypothetical protein
MCLQFGFVIFGQKDLGAKASHKMLVKWTPGGSHVPRYILHLYLVINHIIANKSTTTKARKN